MNLIRRRAAQARGPSCAASVSANGIVDDVTAAPDLRVFSGKAIELTPTVDRSPSVKRSCLNSPRYRCADHDPTYDEAAGESDETLRAAREEFTSVNGHGRSLGRYQRGLSLLMERERDLLWVPRRVPR